MTTELLPQRIVAPRDHREHTCAVCGKVGATWGFKAGGETKWYHLDPCMPPEIRREFGIKQAERAA